MRESLDHLPRMSMGQANMATDKDRQLRVWLLSASTYQGATVYRLAGRFTANGQTWEVHRRYSEFLALRDKLVKFLSTAPDTCPGCEHYLHALKLFAFPKKHLLVSRTAPVVNYRVKALRAFVNLLASWTFSDSPKCPTCGGYAFDVVRNFLVDTATPLSGSDMDFIRESMVISTFANNGERASGLARRNSWIPASASTTLQSQRMTQSQRGSMMGDSQLQRRQSLDQSQRMSQSQRGSMPRRESIGRAPGRPAHPPPALDPRTNAMNDAAYDVFNDYLPERPSNMKKTGHKNTDAAADTSKFSARSLAEEERLRKEQQAKASAPSVSSSSASGQFHMYPDKPPQDYSHSSSDWSAARSDDRDKSVRNSRARAPPLPTARPPAAANRPRGGEPKQKVMFDSFISESSTSSAGMGTEPVFVHGDELRQYGIASSDEEGKFDTEDEIDITGVAHASPPRSRRKTSSGENLWQPWELAKVA